MFTTICHKKQQTSDNLIVKPGLHIICKDRKAWIWEHFFKLRRCDLVSIWSLNDHRHWSLTRNICNRYVGSFKILFEASSHACSAALTTVWKPGFKNYCFIIEIFDKFSFSGILKARSHDPFLRIRFLLVPKNGSCEHIENDLPSNGSVIKTKTEGNRTCSIFIQHSPWKMKGIDKFCMNVLEIEDLC